MDALAWSTNCDREKVCQLLSNQPQKKLLWEWQYEKNPFISDEQPYLALCDAEKLVAFCGTMPVDVQFDNHLLKGHWSLDLFVDPHYRRQGLGHRLYEQIESRKEIAMGFGTSNMAYPLKIKRQWRPNTEVREYFFEQSEGTTKLLVKRILQQLKKIAHPGFTPDRNWRVIDTDTLDVEEVDALWERVRAGYKRSVVRDGRYMHWKYELHPAKCYRFLMVRNGAMLEAIAVYRKSRRVGRLVDFVGPAQSLMMKRLLLRTFGEKCRDAQRLNCISACPDWQNALHQEGYLRYKNPPRFTIFRHGNNTPDITTDWFLMAGDSDGDSIDAVKAMA